MNLYSILSETAYVFDESTVGNFNQDSSTFLDTLFGLFKSILSSYIALFNGLTGAIAFMGNMVSKMVLLIQGNSIEGINLNIYLGNIRYVVGDLVYYEIYVMLMIAVIIELIHLGSKVFSLILMLFRAIQRTELYDIVTDLKFIKWIASFFA